MKHCEWNACHARIRYRLVFNRQICVPFDTPTICSMSVELLVHLSLIAIGKVELLNVMMCLETFTTAIINHVKSLETADVSDKDGCFKIQNHAFIQRYSLRTLQFYFFRFTKTDF